MAAVKPHDVNKSIIAALTADAAVKTALGTTPRVYTRVAREVSTFPWCRIDAIPVSPLTGVMTGSGIQWARSFGRQFTVFSKQTSEEEASDAIKAIQDVMDFAPTKMSITGYTVFMSIPEREFTIWDAETGTWMAVAEWTLSVSVN
jgi:hypothetical protein